MKTKEVVAILGMATAIAFFTNCSRENDTSGIHFWWAEDNIVESSKFEFSGAAQIEALETADPIHEAELAFKRGDRRLAAVSGLAVISPMHESDETIILDKGHGHKIISGTTDYRITEVEREIGRLAYDYAQDYNHRMIALCYPNPRRIRTVDTSVEATASNKTSHSSPDRTESK